MATSPNPADNEERYPPMTGMDDPGRPSADGRAGQPGRGEYAQSNGGGDGDKGDDYRDRGEKQIKPNKVYIGGLPEHTRREDLQSCFGKIGSIANIELKVGYGFVEFESRDAAEESVAKYHEGYFMGQKIKVELSRGGGRTAKYSTDPGACFKCGELGHWARECPNYHRRSADAPLVDRISRDYPPPPPRDYPPPREDYGRYAPPPPRDARYGGFDFPPPPGRDARRPPSPPREFRDYPPPPVRGPPPPRDYYDDRMRGPPGPPPPPPLPPPARYDSRPGPPGGFYTTESPPPPGYPPRSYGPPPPARDPYERFDRGGPPPPPRDRYAPYPPPGGARPRTPPGGPPPPRGRDDFDRPPPRDYPPPPDVRGRLTPPRYADYPPRNGGPDMPPRYRRRSQSPPPRPVSGGPGYAPAGYSAGPPPPDRFGTNGYSGNGAGAPMGGPLRGGPGSRDYLPPRNGRDEAYRRP